MAHCEPTNSFVTATPGSDPGLNTPRLLTTYQPRQTPSPAQHIYTQCKIWEAVRATSAAPGFFDPIIIGNEKFVDGGVGCNNPSEQVYEEGVTLLEPDQTIGCLLSIGTGIPAIMPMEERTSIFALRSQLEPLVRVATDTARVHADMSAKPELEDKYFRFNVEQGGQRISLWMWEKLPELNAHTNA